ncbi:MAG: tyrosine-protein phosphatase [Octadecabacter sp.]
MRERNLTTMLQSLLHKINQWERKLHAAFGTDITDPRERRRSRWHYLLFDHGFLRTFWTNFDQVAPGVYRSNQPDHKRLARARDMGIVSVLNLRGPSKHACYLFEAESCAALGMTLINIKLGARAAPHRDKLLELFAIFDGIARPFLMHCKSGADRAGLASALYLIDQEGKDVDAVRDQLSFKYLHLRKSKTGVLDKVLDDYAARNATDPITIRDWIATHYDATATQAGFDAKQDQR